MNSDDLKILILEDVPEDAEMIEDALAKGGLIFVSRRICSKEDFVHELSDFLPDVILSDYNLPGFDGKTALRIALDITPHTPFILVTGTMSDENAVEMIKSGATDYILKSRLLKLPVAVRRALAEKEAFLDRELMIKSLEESEEKFRAIARSANDAIITIDGGGTCLFYNEAAVRMFSCPPDAFIGKNISLIIPEGSQELHKLGLMKFNETGAGNILGKTVEVMARRMDGSEFPVELVVSGFQMKGKWHATGILRDITERRKWAASLEESNAKLKEAMRRLETTQRLLIRNEKLSAVGQLSAGVAHELKNPLSIISMSVELLQMDTYPAGDRAKTHKTIMEQVRRSAKIIDNLRDFSRERKPEVKVLDVRDLLGKTLELVEYEMRVEGIEINKKIDPALPRINGDPDQLAQVFLNIISNTRDSLNDKRKAVLAGKYGNISWEGVMNVGAWSDGGSISIRFEDNGGGISSENLQRVFDPFFTTKEEGKGTGLGLGIAYGIIQGHGGSIVMESEEGRNAITTVILPAIIK